MRIITWLLLKWLKVLSLIVDCCDPDVATYTMKKHLIGNPKNCDVLDRKEVQ